VRATALLAMAKASRTVEMVLLGGELASPRSAKHPLDAAGDCVGLFRQ
jgi:phosphoribosylaminoimidazole (AIR) synthetase